MFNRIEEYVKISGNISKEGVDSVRHATTFKFAGRHPEVEAYLSGNPTAVCGCALFVSSRAFVSPQVTPKWVGTALCIGVAGIMAAVGGKTTPVRPAAWRWCIVLCAAVLVRTWATDGIGFHLLPPALCLLLWWLATQATERMKCMHIAGILALFGAATALHGVLQYAGVLPSGNGNFPVTGSFDNPAGFAAALACTFPWCFLFFDNKFLSLKYMAVAVAALIMTALALSGSRAGLTACIAAGAVYALTRLKIRNGKLKILLVAAMPALCAALYLFKKDSADGRLLVWRCTWEMAMDKPLFGHGQDAFRAKYMLYQAEYFNAHPDSRYADLADNTLHPFNEYLLVAAEHGMVGLACIVLLGWLLWRLYVREKTPEKTIALLCLLSIAVFACFSYPFKYPFTWVTVFLSMAVIGGGSGKTVSRKRGILVSTATATVAAAVLCAGVLQLRAETAWNRIAQRSLAGKTREMLPEYEKLHRYMGKNGLFLYNHAAELHEAGEYEKSLAVFGLCTRYFNDMDVQMLLADNHLQLQQHDEAEQHYRKAAAMCPVKFMPLYCLAKLYDATGNKNRALELAKIILSKRVKIPSPTIAAIQKEMRRWLEQGENDPATHGGTSVEPLTTKPGRDTVSEQTTPETLLPP